MLTTLIRIYRSWPFRPHCDQVNGIHSFLCRLTGMSAADGPRCGGFDG